MIITLLAVTTTTVTVIPVHPQVFEGTVVTSSQLFLFFYGTRIGGQCPQSQALASGKTMCPKGGVGEVHRCCSGSSSSALLEIYGCVKCVWTLDSGIHTLLLCLWHLSSNVNIVSDDAQKDFSCQRFFVGMDS